MVGGRWSAHLFGLDVEGDDSPLLAGGGAVETGRRVRLRRVPPQVIADRWPADARVLAGGIRDASGRPALEIFADGRRGWLLVARDVGSFAIDSAGRNVECAPDDPDSWRSPGFVAAQILPFAALLQGLEPLHAAGVVIDGAAVALSGPPGAGKSSVTAHLLLAGADLLSDDVVVLEPTADGLLAHPGTSLVSLRQGEEARLSEGDRNMLGALRARAGKAHHDAGEVAGAAPLRALYLLGRSGQPGDPVSLERDAAPTPQALLSCSFNFTVRTPERQVRLLALFAELARSVPVIRVTSPPGRSAAETAAAVAAHARETLA